jgi:glycosyltransferase involved in cell wall biosynthesis
VEASTVRLVRALALAGVEVAVVAPSVGRPPDPVHMYDGIRVQHIGHAGRLVLATNMLSWRRAASRAIEALRPDAVHGQGVGTGGLAACDVSGTPRVVTAHGNARADTHADYNGLAASVRARWRDRLARRVVSEADAIVNVHPDWRVNLPVRPERSIYIPNIVDEVFFAVERAPRSGVVLYCGGPAPIKGWDVLLAAWPSIRRTVHGVSLRAAGFSDPDSVPSVEGLVPLGMLGPEQLAAEMARASVLVIPSRYEVAPLVLSEAWAVGVPVVTTTAGGLEQLAAGAAVQVAPEQPVALADAVCRMLTDDAGAERIVREGADRAARQTASSVASAHIALYEELLRGD